MPHDQKLAKQMGTSVPGSRKKRFAVNAVNASATRFEQQASQTTATTTLIGTITRLRPHLVELRAKGWSLSLLAALVTEDGFQIDAATLGSYLRRLYEPETKGGMNIELPAGKRGDERGNALSVGVLSLQAHAVAVLPTPNRFSEVPTQLDASSPDELCGTSTVSRSHVQVTSKPSLPQDVGNSGFKITSIRPPRRV